MSITSFSLFLLLLFHSLHGCYARRDFGSLDHYKKSKHKSHKVHFDPNNSEVSTSKEKLSRDDQSNTFVKATSDKMRDDHLIKASRSKGSDRKVKGYLANNFKYQRTKKSQVSVSWRVPHKKRGEKQPGFNLDYSPPKTHPPSHN